MGIENDGGPAFPSHGSTGEVAQEGMSLRDYFAGKALPGTMLEYFAVHGACIGHDHPYINIPRHAYRMADAMLRVREEK